MLCSACRVQVWTSEPIPCTCELVLQSHFTCLFHDHVQCSCIGGPLRLVQSHFTCHSHERSSSLFLVLVHRTYTRIRVMLSIDFSVPCSPVSVVLRLLFRQTLFAVTSRVHSRLPYHTETLTTVGFLASTNNRNTPTRHVGILALLLSSSSLRHAIARRVFKCFPWTRFENT